MPGHVRRAFTVRPNLASPDQARNRPAPRLPSHFQAASKVGCALRHNRPVCKVCQVRASATARLVVGCRLRLLAPLRASENTPSRQVSRSQEVYGCQEHAAHDSCRGYPPASEPSDRPNLLRVLRMQVDEQSEQETHAGEDGAAESDKHMPEGARLASNSCCMGRGVRSRRQVPREWPWRTNCIR